MTQSLEDSLSSKDVPGDEALDAALRAALYRRDCPDSLELVEYQMGLLANPGQKRLQVHLAHCPHCEAELKRLVESLEKDVPVSQPWIKELGFEWRRRVLEISGVIIRLLTEPLVPHPLQLAPIPVKGRVEAEPADVVRRVILGPEQTDDLDLEATVRQSSDDPQLCTLTVRAAIPSRWPDLAGTQVRATAGDWRAEGLTDEQGEVTLAGLPASLVDRLVIKVSP